MKRAILVLAALVALCSAVLAPATCGTRGPGRPLAAPDPPPEEEQEEEVLLAAPREEPPVSREVAAVAPLEREPRLEAAERVPRRRRARPESCMVLFRLLDPAGRALAEQPFDARTEVVSDQGSSWSQTGLNGAICTDRGGRARVALTVPWQPGATRWLEARVPEIGGELVGHIDLSRPLESGVHDLGDVFAFPVPLLVEGRVVDKLGAPVRHGEVSVERERMGSWASFLRRDFGADGAFALYDEPPDGPVRLVVKADGYVPSQPIAFTAGDRGLVVVLEAAAMLAGSIRIPGGAGALERGGGKLGRARRAVRITLHESPTTERELGVNDSQTLHREGVFQFGNLPAGRFDLEIGLAAGRRARRADGSRSQVEIPQPAPVVEIRDIETRLGETARDSRLQEIDLSPLFVPR